MRNVIKPIIKLFSVFRSVHACLHCLFIDMSIFIAFFKSVYVHNMFICVYEKNHLILLIETVLIYPVIC